MMSFFNRKTPLVSSGPVAALGTDSEKASAPAAGKAAGRASSTGSQSSEAIIMTEADLAILTIAMPTDTNPSGDIFGGWLMSQMDLAAANVANKRARGRCATVAVDSFHFLTPVHVGDEVSVYARIFHTGRTSMKLNVEAYRRERHGDEKIKVTEADFTFVALDDEGRPRPLPPL
jgi:acyl-CoA thioesterase YciA